MIEDAHIENLYRNLRHMESVLNVGDDRDSLLIDYVNHMRNILEELESDISDKYSKQ